MSANIIKTTDDFKTWYQSKSPTLNTDMTNVYINTPHTNNKPEWIFWFYYSHGGITDLEIASIMNIYSDDRDDIIKNIIDKHISNRINYNSYYETHTYIYVGKEIPDL